MPSLYVVLVEKLARLVVERVVGIGVVATPAEVEVDVCDAVELPIELDEVAAETPIVVNGIVKVTTVGVCIGGEDVDKDRDWAEEMLEAEVMVADVELVDGKTVVEEGSDEGVDVDTVGDEVDSVGVETEV